MSASYCTKSNGGRDHATGLQSSQKRQYLRTVQMWLDDGGRKITPDVAKAIKALIPDLTVNPYCADFPPDEEYPDA